MKKRRLLKLVFCVAFAFLLACDDDGYSLDKAWYSIATVNPLSDNAYSLTLDNGTTLWPAATDIPWYEPKTKRRVQVIYTILSDNFQGYSHAVKILDIQNILTKEIVKDLGNENDEKYGVDPIQILDTWIGDSYLNIEFGYKHGGTGVMHLINLMEKDDANTPYCYELRHNAYGDYAVYSQKGLVSFDLSGLDLHEATEVELTIKANTFDGELTKKVTYKPTLKSGEKIRTMQNGYNVDIK